jgi:hypothetical protein
MTISSRLMLYGVADLFRTILFIPDPFRRLLRSPCAATTAVYLSVPPGGRRPMVQFREVRTSAAVTLPRLPPKCPMT